MKGKFLKKMLVTLLSVVMIAAMFPVCVMAAGDDTETATAISFDKTYKGSITDSNTVDFYKFTIKSSGEVTVKVQTKMERMNVGLYYGDFATSSVFYERITWDSVSKIGNQSFTYNLAAGTYYFKALRGSYFDTVYNGDYSFIITYKSSNESFAETFDGVYNSFDDAHALKLNTKYVGFIAVNDEMDYYKFTLSSKSKVTIVTNSFFEEIFYYLYNSDGEQIDRQKISWNSNVKKGSGTFSYELEKGTYYFVAANNQNYRKYGSYDFTINVPTPTKKPTPTPTKKPTPTPTKKPAQTGWVNSGSVWYYYNTKGTKVTGWQQIGGAWYFFNSKGVMQTGWVQDGGKWYFMAGSGAMATGWVYDGGKWYYMSAAGTMVTGWIQLGGTWYYMTPSGAMATGWQQISGKWYYFLSSGAMKTGWLQLGKTWYYFDANGAMVTGNYKIDGKTNKFSSSGAWIGYA